MQYEVGVRRPLLKGTLALVVNKVNTVYAKQKKYTPIKKIL